MSTVPLPRVLVGPGLPSRPLLVEQIQGTTDIWEASIDMNHRFTFQKIEGGILLRVIGPHEVLDNPSSDLKT